MISEEMAGKPINQRADPTFIFAKASEMSGH